jgi:hypothetical protein
VVVDKERVPARPGVRVSKQPFWILQSDLAASLVFFKKQSGTLRLRRPAQKHWSAADSYAFVIVYWLLTDGC